MAGNHEKRNGAVKVFIRDELGYDKLNDLYKKHRNFSKIADYIFDKYGFLCSYGSLKRIFLQEGGELNKWGGDRKSVDYLNKIS